MEQTYTQRVLSALRDDGRESLSFKGLDDLTAAEMMQILAIAPVYGMWLDAVKEKAKELLGEEAVTHFELSAEYMLSRHKTEKRGE